MDDDPSRKSVSWSSANGEPIGQCGITVCGNCDGILESMCMVALNQVAESEKVAGWAHGSGGRVCESLEHNHMSNFSLARGAYVKRYSFITSYVRVEACW